MAAASTQCCLSVQDLLHEAQSKGFSYRGEMFSVDDMASLAMATVPNIAIQIIEGLSDKRDAIIHSLARGAILLVPYPFIIPAISVTLVWILIHCCADNFS